ncbi:hypothetical protein B0T11DRAFT_47419 [Plectosphaerella cucumerina]|uniref:Gag1-like clamp domain-containing protein n=1 Tax=Plectosphaerella cucumerina TaxID=40658 RepID=A0A8K0THK0_9PEZI|nr:hypothetical protein B0T11DRAFT_47419 [Plectosphaerella cucumerina]
MSSNPTTKPAPSSITTKMQFSDLYKSPRSPLAKFRHSVVPAPLSIPSADYDSDLLSKDKTKQKEAVKKHLQEKVRTDWEFTWPPPVTTPAAAPSSAPAPALEPAQNGHSSHDAVAKVPTSEHDNATTVAVPAASATTATPDSSHNGLTTTPTADDALASTDEDSEDGDNSDAESVYSSMSEDLAHYKPRIEWLSDLSDDDEPTHSSLSPFRFDSPESVGAAVRQSAAEKQARRRRAVREEIQWNEGLACFEARRNAWTSAKTMRVRPKPSSPSLSLSSLSPRRLFSRNSPPVGTSPLQQRQSHDAAAAAAVASDGSENPKDGHAELSAQRSKESTHSAASGASARPHRIQTVLPVPPPLLPPNNPMRASITPSVYISLYEKVILHNLTPSCPVNLSDMMRACVTGWKRDGEWPPRPSAPEPTLVAIRKKKRASVGGEGTRRMSLPFLGRSERTDGDDGGGRGIRKSLQRVFGMGGHGVASPAAAYGPGSMG